MELSKLVKFNEITLQTFQEICMFCFAKSETLISVKNIPRTEIFWKLSGLKIKPNSPQKICQTCTNTYNAISTFVKQIKENIIKFDQLFQEYQNQYHQKVQALSHQATKIQVWKDFKSSNKDKESKLLTIINLDDNDNNEEESSKEVDLQNAKVKSEIYIEETQIEEIEQHQLQKEIICDKEIKKIDSDSEKLQPEQVFLVCDVPKIVKTESNNEKITPNINEPINIQTELSSASCENLMKTPNFYECSICHKEFDTPYKLQYHRLSHKKPEQFQCYNCNKIFRLKPKLKLHIQRVHQRIKNFKCDICGKGFYLLNELREHKNSHTGYTPYICTYCGRGLTRYANYLTHIQYHKLMNGEVEQSETTKSYLQLKCDICNIIFSCPTGLKAHKERFHSTTSETNENNLCFVCGKVYGSKDQLQTHMRSHKKEKKIEKNEENDETPKKPRRNRRDIIWECGAPQKAASRIRRRKKNPENKTIIKPNNNNNWECCGHKFVNKQNYFRHKEIHSTETPYSCTYCERKFKLPLQLKNHTRTHTGEKQYNCLKCDMGSNDYRAFKRHQKTHEKDVIVSTLAIKEGKLKL